jgi:hypothetical protein
VSDERRYHEDEVREIFEAAASAGDAGGGAAARDGLTLVQLQEIGRDVGLSPARIAEAATALDLRRGARPRATHLAMPVSVGTTVPLPRPLDDHEWSLLVAELRQTFRARGEDRSSGSGRVWTNGNLHAYVEATPDGHRLRLGTTKGSARGFNFLGLGSVSVAVVLLLVLVFTGQPLQGAQDLLALAGLGGAALGYNAFTLPRWARERERQMEHVAARALEITGGRAVASGELKSGRRGKAEHESPPGSGTA